MPVVLRFRAVPPPFAVLLRESIENELHGDWTVTVSQSHLDGQWHLLLQRGSERCCVVLPPLGQLRTGPLRRILRTLQAPAVPASLPDGLPIAGAQTQ
jgi:hypothetical protein